MTNLEIVSRIINDIKALNKDEHVSRRYILNVAEAKAKFLMSQKFREMSLYKEDNLFSYIDCFPLQADNIRDCGIVEFRRCDSLMKSKKKLPEMFYSRFGHSIITVSALDGNRTYTPITFINYSKLRRRPNYGKIPTHYYLVRDGYLYLPDSNVEMVDLVLITSDPDTANELSECGSSSNDSSCKSIWEQEFVCSDKLLDVVITQTLQEIVSTNKAIISDENPNMTEIQKDRTIQ